MNCKHCRGNRSTFHSDALSENTVRSNPAVDSTAIIADLKPLVADCFDEVQVFIAVHFTKDNVSNHEHRTIDRRDCAEMTGFDTPLHR